MSAVFASVIEQALQLDPDEKRALIESLVISLDGDPEADAEEVARAWDEEVVKRVDAMDRGDVKWIDGDEVFARLRNTLTQPD